MAAAAGSRDYERAGELASLARLRVACLAGVGGRAVRAPGRKLVVFHADCGYQRSRLREALARRQDRFEVIAPSDARAADADVWMDEYENIPWERVLGPPNILANAYCVRKGLQRKANLAVHLDRIAGRVAMDPEGARRATADLRALLAAVPASCPINSWGALHDPDVFRLHGSRRAALDCALTDAVEFLDAERRAGARRWILKASLSNKGAGIFLVRSIEHVRRVLLEWQDACEWVLQRYVDPPLTLAGRKFHFRVYVLAVGALRVLVFRDALILIAGRRYREHDKSGAAAGGGAQRGASAPEGEDADDSDDDLEGASRFAHLTNTCVNAELPSFKEHTHVRRLTELPPLLEKDLARGAPPGPLRAAAHHGPGACGEGLTGRALAEAAAAGLYAQIRAAVARLFASFRGDVGAFMPFANGFELFGLDFVVDGGGRVMLLEVNAGPDLKQTGTRCGSMITRMLDDEVAVALDGAALAVGDRLEHSAVRRDTGGPAVGIGEAASPGHGWDCVYDEEWVRGDVSMRVE